MLIHYGDVKPSHPDFEALQFFGVRGFVLDWEAHLDEQVMEMTAERWLKGRSDRCAHVRSQRTTRGELLGRLSDGVEAGTVTAATTLHSESAHESDR